MATRSRGTAHRLWAQILAVALVLALPIWALAAEHTVGTGDEFADAWQNDTDEVVTLILEGDITLAQLLEAGVGQTYIINGQQYVLKDVQLTGGGTVQINGDVSQDQQNAALQTQGEVNVTVDGDVTSDRDGVWASGDSSVTVAGSVEAGEDGVDAGDQAQVTVAGSVEAGEDGVYAGGQAQVVVGGDVAGEYDGVYAYDNAQVKVDGDVTGRDDGVDADDQAQVTVAGDVTGRDAGVNADDQAQVTVAGDVTGADAEGDRNTGGNGVEASENAQVAVGGDVTGGSGSLEPDQLSEPGAWSDGGEGVNAYDNAQVTVQGSVTGGDAQGLYGYAADGVYAADNAQVTVGGDVTGGNVTADPQADPEGDDGHAGQGVVMESTAQVTVGGDVTGGSSNHEQLTAGHAVMVVLVPKDGSADPSAPPSSSPAASQVPGSFYAAGTLTGGSNTAGGASGFGLFYSVADYETTPGGALPLTPDSLAGLPRLDQAQRVISAYVMLCSDADGQPSVDGIRTCAGALAQVAGLPMEIPEDATLDEAVRISSEMFDRIMDMADDPDVSDADFETFVQAACAAYDPLVGGLLGDLVQEHLVAPESVTVWQVSDDGAGMTQSSFGQAAAQALFEQTQYLIRLDAPEHGTLSVDLPQAAAGQTVTVTATANEGYKLTGVYLNGAALTGEGGAYAFAMPAGGGVTVSAKVEAVPAETPAITETPTQSGSPAPTARPDNPKTGDDFSWAIFGGLALLSGGALLALLRRKRAA
ncbi:MAG: InlB B-repeat-containing protein [Christensenellales bacterium]|jgi:LPXTG-motif cell wall-anchored protein